VIVRWRRAAGAIIVIADAALIAEIDVVDFEDSIVRTGLFQINNSFMKRIDTVVIESRC
jgi:hypothetical protein